MMVLRTSSIDGCIAWTTLPNNHSLIKWTFFLKKDGQIVVLYLKKNVEINNLDSEEKHVIES